MSIIYPLFIIALVYTRWFREDDWVVPIAHLLDWSVYSLPEKWAKDTPTYICLLGMLLVIEADAHEYWRAR